MVSGILRCGRTRTLLITIDRQRTQESLRFQFRFPDSLWFRGVVGISREMDFRRIGAAAGGVDDREFGGDLDAAAAFRIEAGIEDVGADVLEEFFGRAAG